MLSSSPVICAENMQAKVDWGVLLYQIGETVYLKWLTLRPYWEFQNHNGYSAVRQYPRNLGLIYNIAGPHQSTMFISALMNQQIYRHSPLFLLRPTLNIESCMSRDDNGP